MGQFSWEHTQEDCWWLKDTVGAAGVFVLFLFYEAKRSQTGAGSTKTINIIYLFIKHFAFGG